MFLFFILMNLNCLFLLLSNVNRNNNKREDHFYFYKNLNVVHKYKGLSWSYKQSNGHRKKGGPK